ncbi:MAG: POTRA domain-containing protein [Candidatus Korobacteraceae bacterium]
MPFRILVAPVVIALCAVPAFTQCGDNSFHRYVVVNVNLERPGHLSPAQQASVRSRVIGRCFDSSNTQQLSQRVLDAYQNFGYFRATIPDPSIQIVDDTLYPEPVSLTFDVNEGQQFTVDDVIWHGHGAFTDEQIWQVTSVRPGDVLDTTKVRETLDGVRRLYVSSGYADAEIVPQVDVLESGRVRMNFSVIHGRPADRSPLN